MTTDLDAAYAALRPRGVVRLLELARDEDLGPQRVDLASAALLGPGEQGSYALRARAAGIAAGIAAVPDLLAVYADKTTAPPSVRDGDSFSAGDTLLTLSGRSAAVLRVERPMLNLLSHLCGVATLTARFVAETAGTNAQIYDTRKTTPGLRALEKYAVLCGGGANHRLGLDDAAMFKDNHLAGIPAGRFSAELTRAAAASRQAGARAVFVEADTPEQFARVLDLPHGTVDVVLLDNMTNDQIAAAVRARDAAGSAVALEASGGVTLDTVRAIAQTGVDRISVGAITHSAMPIDLGLDALTD